MRTLLAVVALVLSTPIFAQPVKVVVLPVDSVADLEAWLGKPIDTGRAASPTAYPAVVQALPVGRKTQLPIIVTGLPSPAPQVLHLVADVEVLAADGRSLATSPRCCEATIAKGASSGAALLRPWVGIEPDPARRSGRYTVRATVSDGTQTWTASQELPYGEADQPGSASEAPRLRMNVPASQLEPGGPGDKRGCLSLPTPSEVIRCTERK